MRLVLRGHCANRTSALARPGEPIRDPALHGSRMRGHVSLAERISRHTSINIPCTGVREHPGMWIAQLDARAPW